MSNQLATQTKYPQLTGNDLRIRLAAEQPLYSSLTIQQQKTIMAWVVTMIGIPLPDEMSVRIILDQLEKHFPKLTGDDFKLAFEYNQLQDKPILSYQLFSWAFVCDVIKQYKQHQDWLIVHNRDEEQKQMTQEEIKAANKEALDKMVEWIEQDYINWCADNSYKIKHAAIKFNFVKKAGLNILDREEMMDCLEQGKLLMITAAKEEAKTDYHNKELRQLIRRFADGSLLETDMDKIKHYAREVSMYKLFEKRLSIFTASKKA